MNDTIQIPLQDYGTLSFDDGTTITKKKIDDLKGLLKDTKCSWWTLPESYQKFIENHIIPKQDTWTLECFKSEKDGIWHFDIPEFLTFQESLCNGTETCLDYWFEQLTGGYSPIKGEQLTLTISDKPIEGHTTTITHSHGDAEWDNDANYYLDNSSGILLWLCPYLQSLFKCLPKKLWLKFGTPDYLPHYSPQEKTLTCLLDECCEAELINPILKSLQESIFKINGQFKGPNGLTCSDEGQATRRCLTFLSNNK